MQITGKSLALVVEAIKGAIADIHYHVASCPDVIEFEDELDELEIQQRKYQRLLDRCTKALSEETQK
jgi:hypothetical protein